MSSFTLSRTWTYAALLPVRPSLTRLKRAEQSACTVTNSRSTINLLVDGHRDRADAVIEHHAKTCGHGALIGIVPITVH